MPRRKIVARFGDVNPVEHGGGIVYQTTDGYFVWEYTPGDQKGHYITVYNTFIENDIEKLPINKEHIDSVNSFSGRNKKRNETDNLNEVRIQELTKEDDWGFWANAYWDIFMHSGPNALSCSKFSLTKSKVNKWWGLYTWKGHNG